MKMIIIFDKRDVTEQLRRHFESLNYVVDIDFDTSKTKEKVLINKYDFVIISCHLQKNNAEMLASSVRKLAPATALLAITEDCELETKIRMLGVCDDVIEYPFSLQEFHARAMAIARRRVPGVSDTYHYKDLVLDVPTFRVTCNGKDIVLRNKEFQLLAFFLRHPGIVLSRPRLLESVWDTHADPLTNTVDVHVRSVRSKLSKLSSCNIQTVIRRGYRFM